VPAGYTAVSDPDGAVLTTSTLTLAAGQNNTAQDFGFAGAGQIGDLVWLDQDGDGVIDASEPGVVGASVSLEWYGPDGVDGGTDDFTFTTTTGANGAYLFDNLLPGVYVVRVTGSLPASSTNTYDLDGNHNGATTVTLATSGTMTELGADFGYDVSSVIGDRVWWDVNRNAVQDAGEPGIPNVAIRVTYFGADGVVGGSDDLVFTTTTAANGGWSVTDVPDGAYRVEVTGGVPAGFTATYDASGPLDGASQVTPPTSRRTSATRARAPSATPCGSTSTATGSWMRRSRDSAPSPSTCCGSGPMAWPGAATTSPSRPRRTRQATTCSAVSRRVRTA
jgi:large repetitive protein